MPVFKCKMCGGTLEIKENQSTAVCEYCGTNQTLPKLDDDRRSNLYDRANHFRRNNEFDKAMGIYEKILNEDGTDAEAYWSLVLCRYGIEYVEDPTTHKRVPTVNRAQFTSIFDDEDYKAALQYADGYQKSIYEEEAKTINEIQKGILAISQKEEPFDVFICYKETDANGRRTQDSVLANDLYHQLRQEGFKVFFSRITLEDKLGTAYEPYIFAALNSAKVMVVIGTKPEYFNAVWVKNEWSRYLALIKNGANKLLIPAYRDMDPYDLPEEFSHLQAQDMSKLGFMQDLIRGIKKIIGDDTKESAKKENIVVTGSGADVAPLLKRAFMFLEDSEWSSADEYCEKVLDIDPENAQAYLGKLMADLHVNEVTQLKEQELPFDDNNNYQKAVRFGEQALIDELKGYIHHINTRNETARLEKIYVNAVEKMEIAESEKNYKEAAVLFESIGEYKDSADLAKECYDKAEFARKDSIYSYAVSKQSLDFVPSLKIAIDNFSLIPGWKDADERLEECKKRFEEKQLEQQQEAQRIELENKKKKEKTIKISKILVPIVAVVLVFLILLNAVIIPNKKYNEAVELYNQGKYQEAISAFTELGSYKDSQEQILSVYYTQGEYFLKNGNYDNAIKAFTGAGDYKDAKEKTLRLFYEKAEKALKNFDYLEAIRNFSQAQNYKDADKKLPVIVSALNASSLSAGGYHTVSLKKDGTVVAVGYSDDGQCNNTSNWKDIVAVSAGIYHTVGLKKDGTVVAVGENTYGQCDVTDWKDIVAVSAGEDHTVALKKDGTVVAVGRNHLEQCDVTDWKDIIAVSAGENHTVGLKKDGTVLAAGDDKDGSCNVSDWKDIVAVSAGGYHTIGLKKDGTVVAVGDKFKYDLGQCNVSGWKDIVAVSAGRFHTVGLKKDGTVVAVGVNLDSQCNVSGFTNIKTPEWVK